MVEQLFSAYHHAQKAKKSDESAANSAALAKNYMENTKSYMDFVENAVTKLEEVDVVVENAKEEITNLSTSEQSNIQSTANTTKNEAISAINQSKDEAIISIEDKADSFADKTYVEDKLTELASKVYSPPDYTAGVSISSGYKATAPGWVITLSSSGSGFQSPRVYVDGVTIYATTNLDGTRWGGIVPLKVGQVITFSAVNSAIFYPC